MKEVATLPLMDELSKQEAVAIVRAEEGHISLCLSLSNNGDAEVYLDVPMCERLREALLQAIQIASEPRS